LVFEGRRWALGLFVVVVVTCGCVAALEIVVAERASDRRALVVSRGAGCAVPGGLGI
jgi:hypothetical protein